jgi:hypothetical protein
MVAVSSASVGSGIGVVSVPKTVLGSLTRIMRIKYEGGGRSSGRERELKGVVRVAIGPAQRPCDGVVQHLEAFGFACDRRRRLVQRGVLGISALFPHAFLSLAGDLAAELARDVPQDARDALALHVALLTACDVFGRDAALGKIDVALLVVHAEYDDDLVTADADEFLDGPDATAGELREQNHALCAVILK